MEQDPDSPAVETASAASPSEADRNPAGEAHGPLALEPEPPAGPDAYGFDPADYQWVPVLRKPRADGWSPQRQVDFIAALADTGSVTAAAGEVVMTVQSCYRLRRSPGAEAFAAAWDAALQEASKRLADIAFDRAVNGVDDPVLDKEGRCVYVRTRYNDRLLMFLLRAHQPDRYRHAHQNVRQTSEPPPPEVPPVAEALRSLEPVTPPEPHKLMSPDDLETAIQTADILDGTLPHWHRYKKFEGPPVKSLLGEEFERRLAAAKREAAGLPPEPDEDEGDDEDWDEDAFLA
ncbi:MAG: hypothetical protein QOJ94_1086 [Sphingomonadales bacterium]|jgi:hypothetical protein|nr:hypothetical protein [Sphingomonadales bacterium]